MVDPHQLMIESKGSCITGPFTQLVPCITLVQCTLHAARGLVQLAHFVHPLCKPKLVRITQVFQVLTMCAVARHKQFTQSVCTVRKSSSCACDNRADCEDHVACGSCAARVVSLSCNPKLSYLVYLIHLAHPAQLVALEWSR